ncbi:DUF2335 domain-containing protein [Candidatus Kaiserbacteria bacterium]|nr:DUF2335 domain-containing protein [Candidatus Kaiserbacteria bacterium]
MSKKKKKNKELSASKPVQKDSEPEVEVIRDPKGQVVGFSASKAEFFSGPLPHPDLLNKYKEVDPNVLETITRMAEREQTERLKRQNKIVLFVGGKSILGLIFAFFVVLAGIAAGVYLLMHDKSAEGLFVGIAPFAIVVGTFILQTYWEKDEKETEKDKADLQDNI